MEHIVTDHHHPSRWPRTDPMILVALLFITGIVIGRFFNWPIMMDWMFAAGCLILSALLMASAAYSNVYSKSVNSSQHSSADRTENSACNQIKAGSYSWRQYGGWCALALAILLAGAARWQINQNLLAIHDIARAAPTHGRRFITARMLITSAPQFHASPPRGVLFSATGPSITFFARVAASNVNGRWMPATGNVVVRVPGDLPALRNNQWVQVTGWVSRPPVASNPGGFDYRQYLTTFRVFAQISATQSEQIQIISEHQTLFPLAGWLDAWRLHLRQRLITDAPRAGRTDGYALIALLLGYRDPSIRPLARAFSSAGAAHLLALSGLHVVIIAAAVWMLLKLLIYRPRRRALATLVIVLLYILMTPCGPPVVRAGVGTSLVLISWMLGRPVRALNILATTALIVTLWHPEELFQSPFQLSFIVTLGLILLAHRVHRALFYPWLRRQGDMARAMGTRRAMFKMYALAWIAAIITANLLGSFLALPLVAYHYNQFNPLSVLTGLILLPLVAVAMIAGLIELAAGFGSPALGHAAAMIAEPAARALAWTVRHLAALPGSEIIVRSPPIWLILFFFAIVLAWMFRRHIHIRRPVIVGSFALWAIVLIGWYAVTGQDHRTQIWVLDAGSGDTVVIHARRTVLLDAGSLGSPARLAENVDAALRNLGLWHLDRTIITQIDSAHAAAVPYVARLRGGLAGWTDAMDCAGASSESRRFLSAATAAGLMLHPVATGQSMALSEQTHLKVLWPRKNQTIPRKLRGLILLLQHRREKVLFISRTESVTPVLTILEPIKPVTGVVLLGAGVIHPPLAHWLAEAHPQWVIAAGETRSSCGTDDQALSAVGLQLYQTRKLGAIHVTLTRDDSMIQFQSQIQSR